MYKLNIIISIYASQVAITLATILNAESNFYKDTLERNNKVNKQVWIKSRNSLTAFDKASAAGNFVFRPNSADDDNNLLEHSFNFFDNENSPKLSTFIQREKRSSKRKHRNKRLGKTLASILNKEIMISDNDDAAMSKSKIMSKLRPASVFNDYPYEVAVFIQNNITTENIALNSSDTKRDQDINKKPPQEEPAVQPSHSSNKSDSDIQLIFISAGEVNTTSDKTNKNNDVISENVIDEDATMYNTSGGNTKRSMLGNPAENDIVKKIAFTEPITPTEKTNQPKVRDIFDKDLPVWQQNAPLPELITDNNKYFQENHLVVMPKANANSKPVTEGGLLKVLSMLSNTFKKIMKQHDGINRAHSEIIDINLKFRRDYESMVMKMNDFNSRYNLLLENNDKLKELEANMFLKEESFLKKQKQFADNLIEFENQQKKFLAQQRQFYNMQKIMLTQNEKINIRQSSISKTQNEISLRQNHFAQALKKIKQSHIETKHQKPSSNHMVKIALPKPKAMNIMTESPMTPAPTSTTTSTTTTYPPTTPSMKINLLSFPTEIKYENHDENLLNEKDYQAIDDIVYKFYFNNTYIDNLIKSRILNGFSLVDNSASKRSAKTKRYDVDSVKTTILLPVATTQNVDTDEAEMKELNRQRRWLNHPRKRSKKKTRRHIRTTPKVEEKMTTEREVKDDKYNRIYKSYDYDVNQYFDNASEGSVATTKRAEDPFVKMAKSFCNEIGLNREEQALHWCIEKSIRRLKAMDTKYSLRSESTTAAMSRRGPESVHTKSPAMLTTAVEPGTTMYVTAGVESLPSTISYHQPPSTDADSPPTPNEPARATPVLMYFPDNEELESNLKEYDLKPDLAGNIYFDGSLHVSDIAPNMYSDDLSDFMPGLDSNSRIDVDPAALDMQAKRRAYVHHLNQMLMDSIGRKKIKA